MNLPELKDHTMRRNAMVVALLIAPLATISGCGGSGNNVWVTGKLLKGGAKYVPPQGQFVNVTFVGLEIQDDSGKVVQSAEPFQADLDQENGTFSVPGTEGRGIPPGRYRVAVTQKMSRETFDAAKPKLKKGVNRETDTLGNQFGLGSSPIIREVKTGGEFLIDLDKPAGQ
jgi:hypothetical protein